MHQHPVLPGTSSISTPPVSSGPRIVLALEGLPNAVELQRFFQARGFQVSRAGLAEARQLAREDHTVAAILSTEGNKLESGWLLCKKLLLEQPRMRVVLIGNRPSAKAERLADFLGASAYVSSASSLQTIARAAVGELPSIN